MPETKKDAAKGRKRSLLILLWMLTSAFLFPS